MEEQENVDLPAAMAAQDVVGIAVGIMLPLAVEAEADMAIDVTATSDDADAEGRRRRDRGLDEKKDNPWPYLESFLKYLSESAGSSGKAQVQCLLCLPKKILISVHLTSLSNMKAHVKRVHSTKFREFEDAVFAGSRRGKHLEQKSRHPSSASSASETSVSLTPQKKQTDIAKWAVRRGDTFRFSQEHADEKTVDFFVNNMIALKVQIFKI